MARGWPPFEPADPGLVPPSVAGGQAPEYCWAEKLAGFGPGSGSNGSTSDHSSSETIHGHDSRFATVATTRATSSQTDSHMIDGICQDLLAQHSDLEGSTP